MFFSTRPFIGKTSLNFWSQYWENEPDDPSVSNTKGHLFGLITLSSTTPHADLNLIGRSIIDDFTTNYFRHSGSIASSIQTSATNLKISPEETINLSVIISIVCGAHIYFYIINSGKVYLLRERQFSLLLDGPHPTPLSGQINSLDKILLITPEFSETLTTDNLKNFLSLNIDELEENFSSFLFSLPNQNNHAALVIQIQSEENAVISTPPPVLSSAPPSPVISKPQFIEHSDTRQTSIRKKTSLFVGILLVTLLFGSVFYSYRRNQSQKLEAQFQDIKTRLEQKINDATTVKNLNLDASLKATKEANELYVQLANLKLHSEELSSYQNRINELLTQTGSESNFPGVEIYDTSLIVKKPEYSRIFLSKSKLSLLDSQNGRVDEVDIIKKNYQNKSQSNILKNAKKIIIDQGSLYALFPDSLSLISSDSVVKNIQFNTAQNNFTVTDFAVWNGNFYLLSSDNIYKLSVNPNGFNQPKSWLKDNQNLPSNPTSLAINGRIWVMSTSGQINPYNLGVKENFKTSFTPEFSKAHNLVTSISKDILSFIDGDSTIYVFNKDGSSLAKFNFGDKKILDIVYDEDLNKIYALCSDQKIYQISL